MSYSHGRKWNEEEIEIQISNIVNEFELKHFPSNREFIRLTGSNALSMAISRHGGFIYWAKKMNLPTKESDTSFGNKYERLAREQIEKNTGLHAEFTSTKHPYDIYVGECVKVDVKASKKRMSNNGLPTWSFNLEKKKPTCDIFVFYCILDDYKVYKTSVIPSVKISGNTQLGIGIQSKYDTFIDRWDIIKKYYEFFQAVSSSIQYIPKRRTSATNPLAKLEEVR